ncbi:MULTISPECIES: hypothetical protein [unclassified Nostoc]|uniref:hypothetical protein n=1 Tax=unclassified Nostoc TaxID=2593658 RepID=UPI002AD46438|nr:hypothetical protein [Nostoc sp. DedQUE03]MDZ7974111.1 hypothetical protein [Nostoc sp. DedQUE03]MDZ8048113.1 hypothetical protein [Nostoc sp. DedQUE02]
MAMKRGDRRDSNYDNNVNNPRSRQKEPTPPRELQQLLMTVRAQRDEAQQRAKENELEPDVAQMFPNSEAVNEALRFLIRVTSKND